MKSSKFKTTHGELIIRNARISRRKIGMLPCRQAGLAFKNQIINR